MGLCGFAFPCVDDFAELLIELMVLGHRRLDGGVATVSVGELWQFQPTSCSFNSIIVGARLSDIQLLILIILTE